MGDFVGRLAGNAALKVSAGIADPPLEEFFGFKSQIFLAVIFLF